MPRKRRVLLIGKNQSVLEKWQKDLGVRFHVKGVLDLEDAQHAIDDHPPFTLIAIEPFEDGQILGAIPFIQRLRQTYTKPIIAIATTKKQHDLMIRAGCNASTPHDQLPHMIYDTLRMSWQHLPRLRLEKP